MTQFLTVEDVLEIHRQVIAATGGVAGIRDVGLLDSAVHRPQASFGGSFLYPSLAEQAAALVHSLASNHPFVDGNKRVAYTCLDVFLRVNAHRLIASEYEKYDFVMGVARSELSIAAIVEWLADRARPS